MGALKFAYAGRHAEKARNAGMQANLLTTIAAKPLEMAKAFIGELNVHRMSFQEPPQLLRCNYSKWFKMELKVFYIIFTYVPFFNRLF